MRTRKRAIWLILICVVLSASLGTIFLYIHLRTSSLSSQSSAHYNNRHRTLVEIEKQIERAQYRPPASEESLRKVLQGITQIKVRSAVPRNHDLPSKTYFEINDASLVGEVISRINIDEDSIFTGTQCACWGRLTFEFYKKAELLASVSFRHGKHLRWNGWQGDGHLTDECRLYLYSLLREHGLAEDDYM